jgi:hypothetical protein
MSLIALEFEQAQRRAARLAGRALSWDDEEDLLAWAAQWEQRHPIESLEPADEPRGTVRLGG